MELKNYFAQDALGNALPGATVHVYEPGTTTHVSGLEDAAGAPLANPFLADADALIQFAAPDGLYDLRVISGPRDYTIRVQANDSRTTINHAATSAVLRAQLSKGAGYLVEAPAGSPQAFASFFKTGNTDLAKAGQSVPPFIYDTAGTEYVERRPISHQHIPQLSLDNTPKILVESPTTAGEHLIILRKREIGYLVVQLRNNLTTTASSLATSGSDTTMRRVTGVLDAVSALVGQLDSFTTVGNWITASLGQVAPEVPAFTGSSTYNYRRSTDTDATLTFTVAPYKGFISLAFLCGTTSNANATVTVDGVAHTVNLNNGFDVIRYFRFPAWKASVTVEIKNTGAGFRVNYLGRDFSTLDKWEGAPANNFGYYRNSANADYLTNNSENDYVIREFNSNIYGGGYHGGEASISDTYQVDGVTVVPSATPVVGSKLSLQSACSIDWTPAGTPVVAAIRKRYDFIQGGYYSSVGIDADMVCSELYAALFGANEAFDLVDAPLRANLAVDVANNERLLVGRTSKIVLRHPGTGQTITADYTVSQDDTASQYGGQFIWRVDGSYDKLYNAVAHAGRYVMTGNYSCTRYEFNR